MPIYHSSFNNTKSETACGAAILPLKTGVKGPAPSFHGSGEDIIDEAISCFRANVLFRKYDIQGPADRTLCYLTVYIGECLRTAHKYSHKEEGKKQLITWSMGNFSIPGDRGFSLGGFFNQPKNRSESDLFRAAFRQLREEMCHRLPNHIYDKDGKLSKWWMMFNKRKFMNIEKA